MSDLVSISNPVSMSSVEIAGITGKRHDNIVRDLKDLSNQGVIDLLNFEEISKDSMNRDQTIYRLPKRETLILTSGYSAIQRAKIIDRWLELEETQPKMTSTEMLLSIVQNQVDIERQQARQDHAQLKQQQALDRHEQKLKQFDSDTGYLTASAYCKKRGVRAPLRFARDLGKLASKISKELEITIGSVPDERYGSVNSYAVDVLDEAMQELVAGTGGNV